MDLRAGGGKEHLMVLIILAIVLMEKVNAVKVGQDYGEDIEAAAADGEPDPKEKEKVEKKEKEKEKNKSSQQKKGFGADAFKKLNRQRQGGCGFFGTIGCPRFIYFATAYLWVIQGFLMNFIINCRHPIYGQFREPQPGDPGSKPQLKRGVQVLIRFFCMTFLDVLRRGYDPTKVFGPVYFLSYNSNGPGCPHT